MSPPVFRSLAPDKLLATVKQLRRRIEERFPQARLGRVCAELEAITTQAQQRCVEISRSHPWLRVGIAAVVACILALLVAGLASMRLGQTSLEAGNFVPMLEAGMNAAVLIGAAVLFLATVEGRLKRRRALAALHELRSLAHVIDMHQLTKDPERLLGRGPDTASSPARTMTAFELQRYLDYCTEMLSLVGKVAALYGQHLADGVVLSAASDVEVLTTDLSRKIWQKISSLHTFARSDGSDLSDSA